MPTYAYKCSKCGHMFENFQSIKDETVPDCPKCGGKAKKIVSGGTGFILKGSGFYVNDYGKKSSCCSVGKSCATPKKCCEK